MSLKTTFENHPVVWGLSLVVFAFGAGFGARAFFPPSSASLRTCTVEGLASFEAAHSKEIEVLNTLLVENEAQAASGRLIPSDVELRMASADRIRSDIERSNRTYLSAIDTLTAKCK